MLNADQFTEGPPCELVDADAELAQLLESLDFFTNCLVQLRSDLEKFLKEGSKFIDAASSLATSLGVGALEGRDESLLLETVDGFLVGVERIQNVRVSELSSKMLRTVITPIQTCLNLSCSLDARRKECNSLAQRIEVARERGDSGVAEMEVDLLEVSRALRTEITSQIEARKEVLKKSFESIHNGVGCFFTDASRSLRDGIRDRDDMDMDRDRDRVSGSAEDETELSSKWAKVRDSFVKSWGLTRSWGQKQEMTNAKEGRTAAPKERKKLFGNFFLGDEGYNRNRSPTGFLKVLNFFNNRGGGNKNNSDGDNELEKSRASAQAAKATEATEEEEMKRRIEALTTGSSATYVTKGALTKRLSESSELSDLSSFSSDLSDVTDLCAVESCKKRRGR